MKTGPAGILPHNPLFIVLLMTAGTILASMFITLAVSVFVFLLGTWMEGGSNLAGLFLFQAQEIFFTILGAEAGSGMAHGGFTAALHATAGELVFSILRNATLTGLVSGVAVIIKNRQL